MPIRDSGHSWLLNQLTNIGRAFFEDQTMNRNGWSDTQLMQAMANAAGCMGENYHETTAALRKAGFNCLGSGAYGSAHTRPDMKGYVVKVSSGQGDTYPAFVYWAMANPMACLPEFRHPVFSSDREQFMVMLPRYTACAEELQGSIDYDRASEIVYGHDRFAPIVPNTPLQHAARCLRDFFGGDVGWDFHRGNLMWDSVTQKYVITDPMCSGNCDALVTKITGKGTEGHIITEQVDFGFGLETGREWPRPEYADRVVEVPLGAGLHSHVKRDQKLKHQQLFGGLPVQKFRGLEGIQLMELEDLGLQHCKPVQLKARIPDALGRAANWVREQGMSPQVAKEIAKMAQNWPDDKIRMGNLKWINFCLAPSMPAFIAKAMPEPAPLKPVKRWEVPVSVVRVLRDQYAMENGRIDPHRIKLNNWNMQDRR